MGGVGDFFETLFKGAPDVSIPEPTVKATDILQSTNSKTPDSASLGSSSSNGTKKRGKNSLRIPKVNNSNSYNRTTSGGSGLNI